RARHRDERPLRGLELRDGRRRIDVDLPLPEEIACESTLPAPRDQPVRPADEREPVRPRVRGRQPVREDVAAEADRPGSRLVHAGEDLDQRALAGAVLSQKRDHLAPTDAEVDPAQRVRRAEAAFQSLDDENVLLGRSRRRTVGSGCRYFLTPQSFNHAAWKSYELAMPGPLVDLAFDLSTSRNGIVYFSCGLWFSARRIASIANQPYSLLSGPISTKCAPLRICGRKKWPSVPRPVMSVRLVAC